MTDLANIVSGVLKWVLRKVRMTKIHSLFTHLPLGTPNTCSADGNELIASPSLRTREGDSRSSSPSFLSLIFVQNMYLLPENAPELDIAVKGAPGESSQSTDLHLSSFLCSPLSSLDQLF
jgi:hypothetical protein